MKTVLLTGLHLPDFSGRSGWIKFLTTALILIAVLFFGLDHLSPTKPAQAQTLSDQFLQQMQKSLKTLSGSAAEAVQPPVYSPPKNPQNFDFYVLSLSWSPNYCSRAQSNSGEFRSRDLQQCSVSRQYGFVAHGLWPQFENGFPQSCSHPASGDAVPRHILTMLQNIMPAAGLIRHQWRKHGTCSGLNQQEYFSTLLDAYQRIKIPPALRSLTTARSVNPQLIEKAFITANPGMLANGIAVTCKQRQLEEVRICMTSDLKFRSCPQVDAKDCRSRTITLLPNQ